MSSHLFQNFSEKFFLLDYSPSHKQLTIRSKRNKERFYNINLLFKGVSLIHLPAEQDGLAVSVCTDEVIAGHGF
jgi:hypothetical protein